MLKRVNFTRNVLPLVAISIACLSLRTLAAASANLSKTFQQCTEISSDKQRLACFDGLILSSANAETALVKGKSAQAALNTDKMESFAKEHLQKTVKQEAEEVKSIDLTISQLKKMIRGEWKITFENGQKWQQKDTTRISLKKGDNIIIEKGTLSAFYLRKVGGNKRIRVKRLK